MNAKNIAISLIILPTFVLLVLQKDFWPFSSFPMFKSNFKNYNSHLIQTIQLAGLTSDGQWRVINDQKIIGAIRPGALPFFIQHLVDNNDIEKLDTLMKYWKSRMQKNSIREFTEIAIVYTLKNKNQYDIIVITDWRIQI